MKTLLLLVVLTTIVLPSKSQLVNILDKSDEEIKAVYTIKKNVAYGADSQQNMDVYISQESKQLGTKNFTIVFIHGGGWYTSDKEAEERYILPYLKKGINVINLNYRLRKGVAIATEDLTIALNFLKINNTTYEVELSNVILSGFSAGGHMAAIVGLSVNNKKYKNKLDKFIKIAGIIDFSGPVDQLDIVEKRFIDWNFQSKELNSTDIGNAMFPSDGYVSRDSIIQFEPITYFDKKDPPFFLWYGGSDNQIFPSTFEIFVKLLHQNDSKNIIVFDQNYGHSPKSSELKEAYNKIFLFLDKL